MNNRTVLVLVATGLLLLGGGIWSREYRQTPMATLVNAAKGTRAIETRVSGGFGWARLDRQQKPARELVDAASAIFKESPGGRATAARHF